jgi:TolB-like protein
MIRTSASLLLLIGLAAGAARAQDRRPVVAVLPLENGGSYGRDKEEFDALRRGIAGLLIAELGQNTAIRLVGREQAQKQVDEQGGASAERIDAATAAKIGRQLGARYVIVGTYVDLYGDFRVDARIVDVESGEVAKVVRSDPKLSDRKQMYKIIQSVAERVADGAKLPPLPAPKAQAAAARNVPAEAVAHYSRALLYQDRGDRQRAIEAYGKAVGAAPEFAEAREGLRQLRGS